MAKIKFIKKDENTYDAELNGESYGLLELDLDQNAWVLWFWGCYGDEGVTYFEDLEETKKCIADEIYFCGRRKKQKRRLSKLIETLKGC